MADKKVKQTAAEASMPKGTPEPIDIHTLDGQIYTVLKNRVERGKANQKEWWAAGKKIRSFIKGVQWDDDSKAMFSPENGWIRKNLNKMKALETGLLSQVAFQSPKVAALPLRRNPSHIGAANVDSTLINHSLKEGGFDASQKRMAKDALHFGAGFGQVGTNPEKGGIPTILWRAATDVVVDPDAVCIEDAKWIARRETLNVHAARKKFDDLSIVSDQQHDRENNPNHKPEGIAKAPEDETIEVWEIWCRADAINFMDASEADARNKVKDSLPDDAPAFLKHLTENGNRVFRISLNHPKLLSDAPWPFVIDNDMLPIWPVYLDLDTEEVLPPSPLLPAQELQRSLNTAYTFLMTQAYTTARIKFVGDKAQLSQENVTAKLKSPMVGDLIGIEGGMLNIQPLNFGPLNNAMVQVYKESDNQFVMITGFNEIFGGMQGTRSATEASIRESRAQTNSSTMRAAFEIGLDRMTRAMDQIAHSTLKADKVADIVGREEMGYVNPETGLVDDDEKLNKKAVNWDDDMTPEEIRRENRIELVINSTRRVNQEQVVTDMRNLITDLMGLVSAYTQQGYRINKTRMARKINYVFSRLLQAMGLPDFKQIEVLPEDLEIDDRLMPRGKTEQQLLQQFEERKAQEAQEADQGNVEGITEFFTQFQGMPPEVIQEQLAQLTPEMRASLVQMLEGED